MADVIIPVDPQAAIFYDPDTHTPDTSVFLFPLSTDYPDGTEIKLANYSDSVSSVTFRAQGSDLIANPSDATSILAEHSVSNSQGLQEYMLFGNVWHLSQSGRPKLAQQVLDIFSFASYGKMELSAPAALPGDIGATWDTIDVFDLQPYTPRGITVNLTNNSFTFLYDGIYSLSTLLNYIHNEAQQSRQTQLRVYNLTDGTGATAITIPIARNQDATLIALTTSFEVVDADKNKEFVLQIGNGDVISVVSIEAASWETHAISEWREPLTG